jgi:hypothetical protein
LLLALLGAPGGMAASIEASCDGPWRLADGRWKRQEGENAAQVGSTKVAAQLAVTTEVLAGPPDGVAVGDDEALAIAAFLKAVSTAAPAGPPEGAMAVEDDEALAIDCFLRAASAAADAFVGDMCGMKAGFVDIVGVDMEAVEPECEHEPAAWLLAGAEWACFLEEVAAFSVVPVVQESEQPAVQESEQPAVVADIVGVEVAIPARSTVGVGSDRRVQPSGPTENARSVPTVNAVGSDRRVQTVVIGVVGVEGDCLSGVVGENVGGCVEAMNIAELLVPPAGDNFGAVARRLKKGQKKRLAVRAAFERAVKNVKDGQLQHGEGGVVDVSAEGIGTGSGGMPRRAPWANEAVGDEANGVLFMVEENVALSNGVFAVDGSVADDGVAMRLGAHDFPISDPSDFGVEAVGDEANGVLLMVEENVALVDGVFAVDGSVADDGVAMRLGVSDFPISDLSDFGVTIGAGAEGGGMPHRAPWADAVDEAEAFGGSDDRVNAIGVETSVLVGNVVALDVGLGGREKFFVKRLRKKLATVLAAADRVGWSRHDVRTMPYTKWFQREIAKLRLRLACVQCPEGPRAEMLATIARLCSRGLQEMSESESEA